MRIDIVKFRLRAEAKEQDTRYGWAPGNELAGEALRAIERLEKRVKRLQRQVAVREEAVSELGRERARWIDRIERSPSEVSDGK